MNKFFISQVLFTILVTACSSTQSASTQTSDDLPMAAQLVLGTLKLEDTDQAVTKQQATELLPMWQVYQDLTSSDTAAQEEIDGLTEQIQETMSADQMSTITSMNLTQQDVFAITQEQGGRMALVRQNNDGSSSQSSGGFVPPDGGMGGDPPPDDGMGDFGDTGSSVSTGQNQGAETGTSLGRSSGVPSALVQVLIEVLEQKADS